MGIRDHQRTGTGGSGIPTEGDGEMFCSCVRFRGGRDCGKSRSGTVGYWWHEVAAESCRAQRPVGQFGLVPRSRDRNWFPKWGQREALSGVALGQSLSELS